MNHRKNGIDLTGQRFNSLLVTGLSERKGNAGQKMWDCVCDCGNTHTVFQQSLKSGITSHCSDHPKNRWWFEGDYAVVDVSCPAQPNTITKVDVEDLRYVLDYRGRGGRLKWFAHDSSRKKGYWGNYVVSTDRKMRLHRYIMRLDNPVLIVDHINGDTLDNRKSNLRVITRSDNGMNVRKRINNTSGYTGVQLNSRTNLWKACIRSHGKNFYLGEFDTKEQANIAYRTASKVLDFTERHGT